MNQETVELVSQSVIRMVAVLERLPVYAAEHSDHVYRNLKLSLKMGFGSLMFAIHAVFPFLFTTATKEVLQSLCEARAQVASLEPQVAVLKPQVASLEPQVAVLKPSPRKDDNELDSAKPS